jgi:hypothetical protein
MREAFGAPTIERKPGDQPDNFENLGTANTSADEAAHFDDTAVEVSAGPSFRESARAAYEDTKQSLSSFGERAQAFLGTMSERGKAVAEKMYEGVYKLPGVQRLAGKMEISYNQFFVDRHENKALNLREQADILGPKIDAVGLAAQETNAAIETLRGMGAPGLAGLERKALELDQQKLDLMLSRDSLTQRAEARMGRMEHFKGKRDLIADRLIDTYSEKMAPLENRLQSLGANLELAETQAEITRAEHEEQLRTLTGLEGRRNTIAQLLGSAGLNERDVARHEVIKLIDTQIAAGREKVRVEDENIERSLNNLHTSIANSKAKVGGYRTKQQEFQNLKRRTLTPEQLRGGSQYEEKTVEDPTSENDIEENFDSFEDEEDTVEETVSKLSAYLEDSPNTLLTKEKKQERLKALLEADPNLLAFFQDMFDEKSTDQERERLVETFNKKQHALPDTLKGFDIRLPGKDRARLIIEGTQNHKASTRILRHNV